MNEVTRIHLGRQPFTISVDAHHELKSYLASIKKKVADKEVMEEVELRMSELLAERGVKGEKVVIAKDVEYLKEQLGQPEEFSDDEEAGPTTDETDRGNKRLFRDTDNAIIAGVSAGIANYFGLDAVLVRLLFVIITIFSGGTGVVLYLVLWLVLPPAVTTSEKLQMRGKPVTLDALKDSLNKADVPGTARRVNNSLLAVIDTIFRVLVKLVGIGFILAGILTVFSMAAVRGYMALHNGQLFQENLFPVGLREQWLLGMGMLSAVIAAVFLMLIGIATLKRKWPVRAWITGLLAGLLLVCLAGTAALAADAAPRIQERYQTSMHTTGINNITPFNKVITTGAIDIEYVPSPDYAVNVRYFDHPDLSKLAVNVKDNTLYVNSEALDATQHCTMLCIFPRYNMTVQIYAPNIEDFKTPRHTDIFYPNVPPVPAKP